MRSSALVATTLLGLAVLAGCSSDPASGSVQIDPASTCTGAACADPDPAQHADGGTSGDVARPSSDEDAGASSSTSSKLGSASDSNTCATATDLGSMAGELIYAGSTPDQKSAQDRCSKWFTIRMNETSKLIGSFGVKATLVSPPSTKFDLYGYIDTAKDDVSCTTPAESSASTLSNVDTVEVDWPDTWFNDDSRTVTFEVRSHSGACDPSSTWSLIVSQAEDPNPPSSGGL